MDILKIPAIAFAVFFAYRPYIPFNLRNILSGKIADFFSQFILGHFMHFPVKRYGFTRSNLCFDVFIPVGVPDTSVKSSSSDTETFLP
jgi:hypothetical protein